MEVEEHHFPNVTSCAAEGRQVFNHCLPRMRGDRPRVWATGYLLRAFTPHARGSTILQGPGGKALCVYPACAGIDPPYIPSNPIPAGAETPEESRADVLTRGDTECYL